MRIYQLAKVHYFPDKTIFSNCTDQKVIHNLLDEMKKILPNFQSPTNIMICQVNFVKLR